MSDICLPGCAVNVLLLAKLVEQLDAKVFGGFSDFQGITIDRVIFFNDIALVGDSQKVTLFG